MPKRLKSPVSGKGGIKKYENNCNNLRDVFFALPQILMALFIIFPFLESIMERDRYMSPMEAQDFGLIDRVLVHPPQAGQDEPELVQKEPAAASPAAQPEAPAALQSPIGTSPPSSYKPEP